jgi:protein-arginine kinase activator protein McsA
MGAKLTLEKLLERFKTFHGEGTYDYSQIINYKSIFDKIKIICPIHGEFTMTAKSHSDGQGCKKCGLLKRSVNRQYDTSVFIKKANVKHGAGTYDYSKVDYKSAQNKVEIICPKHGSFWQRPTCHIQGTGCPQCAIEKRNDMLRGSLEDFIIRAEAKHGKKYNYSKSIYKNIETKVEIICSRHGSFWQTPEDHIHGSGCPKCTHVVSQEELEIANWVKSLGFNVIQQDRSILKGKELDIYIPHKNLAIECNGLYWHSTLPFIQHNSKPKSKSVLRHKHELKYLVAKSNDIRLIQIWDYEWNFKQDICKDIIKFALGCIDTRIFARKCSVLKINSKTANCFLDKYHIQGRTAADYRLGLFYEKKLVGVQCYKSPNSKRDYWLLTRTAFKRGYQIIGGISKMFKKFITDCSPERILDYTDLRLFTASGHYSMGFTQKCKTKPCSYYTNGRRIFNRERFFRNKFENNFSINKEISWVDNLASKGIGQIWDVGKMVNVWER